MAEISKVHVSSSLSQGKNTRTVALCRSPEARHFGVRFGAAVCKRTMEHTATIIICKKNPNVSESSVSPRNKA